MFVFFGVFIILKSYIESLLCIEGKVVCGEMKIIYLVVDRMFEFEF